jgi:Na+/H+ antiporter NhaD/arsenite permease-like protein
MPAFVLTAFAVTYLGMALGRVPGLRLDRTGIAMLAAVLLLAVGAVAPAKAVADVDFPTLAILFGLMVLSAQFGAAGFYDASAARIAASRGSAHRLLAVTVVVAGALSAVLANDVVVFAMTPLLCVGVRARGLDARPFLAALAGASNAGSAATIIGNPQNILIGEVGHLDFWRFAAVCGVPAMLAMGVTYATVVWAWRHELAASPAPSTAPVPPVDRRALGKAVIGTGALLGLFASPLPRAVSVLVVASALLVSRRRTPRDTLAGVDWHLILLFAALFVVNGALESTGLPAKALDFGLRHGLVPSRLAMMAPLAAVSSNTIGNVPAVILLLHVWPDAPTGAMYGLALLTTLAGNLLLVGSIANLIVAERAAAQGVRFGFADHARAGVPMGLASMAIAALWLGLGGHLPWA